MAQQEVTQKTLERSDARIRAEQERAQHKRKAKDIADAREKKLVDETCKLIKIMHASAIESGVSNFGQSVMDVLNNYQGNIIHYLINYINFSKKNFFLLAALNTIRNMTKNLYDGVFFVTNDVRSLEQGQTLIMERLDQLDAKVCY